MTTPLQKASLISLRLRYESGEYITQVSIESEHYRTRT
jgi:hypothetical protein